MNKPNKHEQTMYRMMKFDKHFSSLFISPEAALDKGIKLSTARTGTELDHNDHTMKRDER